MKYVKIVVLFLAVSLLIFAQNAVSQDKDSSIDSITFIADFDSPPFSFRKGLAPDGFEIDLAKALARQLGMKLLWKEMTFDPEVFARCLNTKVADAAITSITITNGRLKIMTFSRPYFLSGQSVAIGEKAGWKGGNVVEALKGKRLGAMERTTGEAYARKKLKGAEIQTYHTADSLAMALKAGYIDAIIMDEEILAYLAAQYSFRFRLVARNLTREEYGIAVSKKNPDLLRRINTALEKLGESGEYARIYEKWFGRGAGLPTASD